jgi:hypothetical protein
MSGVNTSACDPHESRVFVGREREMGELRRGLATALSGQAQLFGVTGPRGIGKTRLAEAISAEARMRGALVLRGRCWEGGDAPAFWPWLQVIRSVRASERSALEPFVSTIGRLLPELDSVVSGEQDSAPIRRDDPGFPLLDAIADLLGRAAQAHPLVLVLDDVHAADGPSLQVLQFVARALGESPLLIVATRQPGAAPATPERSALFAALCHEGWHLPLGGLGQADVAELVGALAGATPSAAFVRAVHDLTQGNPFFLDEIIGHLRAEGRLDVGSPLAPPTPIPTGVREVINADLMQLPDSARQLLSAASVIGRTFELASVQQACDLPMDAVLEALGDAVRAGCLQEVAGPTPGFAFAHPLVRETLYRDLPAPRRASLQARAACRSPGGAGAAAPVRIEWHASPWPGTNHGSAAQVEIGSAASEPGEPSPSRERRILRRDGEYWTIVFDGQVVRVRDTLGLRWLGRLVRYPNQEFRAIDLAGSDDLGFPSPGIDPRRSDLSEPTLAVRTGLGDAGEVLDARAKTAYAQRLQGLRVEREEALARGDTERASRAEQESEILVRELARAVGLAGRSRRAASSAERARVNVTRRIRSAVSRIAAHHPVLGRHLATSIKTGYVCSYAPVPAQAAPWES